MAELWHVNPQIQNPHLIYPGDTLSITYVDGQPRLVLNRGEELVIGGETYQVREVRAIGDGSECRAMLMRIT